MFPKIAFSLANLYSRISNFVCRYKEEKTRRKKHNFWKILTSPPYALTSHLLPCKEKDLCAEDSDASYWHFGAASLLRNLTSTFCKLKPLPFNSATSEPVNLTAQRSEVVLTLCFKGGDHETSPERRLCNISDYCNSQCKWWSLTILRPGLTHNVQCTTDNRK